MTPFYTIRRAYMTLLETLIAISLLSIVLVFVFGFFRELAELTRMTDRVQKKNLQNALFGIALEFHF